MIQPPIDWHPPTTTNMTKLIWVTGVDDAPYFLYTQNDYHRYKHSFSLFIEGATDDRNNKAIIDNLHVAVRNYSRGKYRYLYSVRVSIDIFTQYK